MGSSPTPGASSVGSAHIVIYFKSKHFLLNSSNSITNTLLIDSTREVNDISGLSRKIDSITKTLSRPYFNKILKDLLEVNPHNANIVIDYLITEQTELNIKDSTKEWKIKVLV